MRTGRLFKELISYDIIRNQNEMKWYDLISYDLSTVPTVNQEMTLNFDVLLPIRSIQVAFTYPPSKHLKPKWPVYGVNQRHPLWHLWPHCHWKTHGSSPVSHNNCRCSKTFLVLTQETTPKQCGCVTGTEKTLLQSRGFRQSEHTTVEINKSKWKDLRLIKRGNTAGLSMDIFKILYVKMQKCVWVWKPLLSKRGIEHRFFSFHLHVSASLVSHNRPLKHPLTSPGYVWKAAAQLIRLLAHAESVWTNQNRHPQFLPHDLTCSSSRSLVRKAQ